MSSDSPVRLRGIWTASLTDSTAVRLWLSDCAKPDLEGQASIAGLTETSYFPRETSQEGLSPTHSISGKVKLMDQWSINLCFSFLNLLDSPSLSLCPCLVPSFCFLWPLVSFKIFFVYSDPCEEKQSSSHFEACFNSNCL